MPDAMPRQLLRQLPPALRAAGLRLRGGDAAVPVQLFQAEAFAIALRCETEHGQVLISGVVGQGDHAPPILARLLRADASPVDEALVEGASFELGPVPPGVYQLEVLLPDRLLVIASVAIPPPPSAASAEPPQAAP
jgi:hypothetical protein